MLERAILFKEQLHRLFVEASDSPDNKFYSNSYWDYELTISTTNWERHQFVSVDKFDNIVGFLQANVLRDGRYIDNIAILRFNKDKQYNYIYSKDLRDFFLKLFVYYKYNKIEYSVAVGSPNEKWYDKFTRIYGGRIVGCFKEHWLIEDGTKFDLKMYEIFRNDFINEWNIRHPKHIF